MLTVAHPGLNRNDPGAREIRVVIGLFSVTCTGSLGFRPEWATVSIHSSAINGSGLVDDLWFYPQACLT